MKKSRFNTAVISTALTLALAASLSAQERSSPSRSDEQQTDRTDTSSTASTSTQSTAATGDQVMKVNKASQLVGMTVKNADGEKLGKIDDVVIDFQNDKVAYCVLAVSQGAFSADKLHAVPLRAFQPSSDGTSLTLNADKDRLAQAPGFDKDSWPSPSHPAWGAQPFWQENSSTASPANPNSYWKNRDQNRSSDNSTGNRDYNRRNNNNDTSTTPNPGSTP